MRRAEGFIPRSGPSLMILRCKSTGKDRSALADDSSQPCCVMNAFTCASPPLIPLSRSPNDIMRLVGNPIATGIERPCNALAPCLALCILTVRIAEAFLPGKPSAMTADAACRGSERKSTSTRASTPQALQNSPMSSACGTKEAGSTSDSQMGRVSAGTIAFSVVRAADRTFSL